MSWLASHGYHMCDAYTSQRAIKTQPNFVESTPVPVYLFVKLILTVDTLAEGLS